MAYNISRNRSKLFRAFEDFVHLNQYKYGVQDTIADSWFGLNHDVDIVTYVNNSNLPLYAIFLATIRWSLIDSQVEIAKLSTHWQNLVRSLESKGYVFDEKV